MSKIVYEDKEHQKSMTAILERSRQRVQKVVDAWNRLDMTACGDTSRLYELVHNPRIPYQEGVNKMMMRPDGVTEAKWQQHLSKIRIPSANELLAAAEDAQEDIYTDREMMLFDIQGDKVVLSPKADEFIQMKTVTADNEEQEEFAAAYIEFVDRFNELNRRTGGRMLEENTAGWARLFNTPVRFIPGDFEVTASDDFLRATLPRIA